MERSETTDRPSTAKLTADDRRVALLACGSFNPPTYMHLRMFERAKDYLQKTLDMSVVEGIMSPSADRPGRPEIVAARHRQKMLELALASSAWIRADGWECSQGEWTKPLHVLQHFKQLLDAKYGADDAGSNVRLVLLCGGDALESFATNSSSDFLVCNPEHVEEVVQEFGLIVVIRANTNPLKAIYQTDVLRAYQKNIFVIEDETCPNDVSSTRLRTALRRHESIRYCINDEVIKYIDENNLYKGPSTSAINISKSSSSSSISLNEFTSKLSGKKSRLLQKGDSLNHNSSSSIPNNSSKQPLQLRLIQPTEIDDLIKRSSPVWYPSTLPDFALAVSIAQSNDSIIPMQNLSQTLPAAAPQQTDHCTEAPIERHGLRRSDSLDYDNVTLDELLAFSAGCFDYLSDQKDELPANAQSVDAQWPDLAGTSEASNPSMQSGHSPQSRQGCSSVDQKPPIDSKDINTFPLFQRSKTSGIRTIRFAHNPNARSAENLPHCVLRSSSHSHGESSSNTDNGDSNSSSNLDKDVTLTYRKYKLTSSPETTV